MMVRLPKILVVFACCLWVVSAQSQSYISRLWNTKKYEAITEYSVKGATLSGQDNAFVGRAFMALDPPQPMRALSHYDLAIAKRWQREDLYFFRSEANYAIKKYDAALCIQHSQDHCACHPPAHTFAKLMP